MGPVGWGSPGGGGYPSGPPPVTGLGYLGLLDVTVHELVAALQGLVVTGVVVALYSPSLDVPAGRVATLSLIHLCFSCMVAGDGDLPPTCEAVRDPA